MKNLISFALLGVAGFFLNRYLTEKFGAFQAQAANLPGQAPRVDLIGAPPGSDEARGGIWMQDFGGTGRYVFPGDPEYTMALAYQRGEILF